MSVPIQRFQRKFTRSKIPQANYATATVGNANFVQVLAKGDGFANEQPNLADNREYATGYRQATEQWLVNHDAGVQWDYDICFQEIGRALLLAFGKVVTSQPDAVNSPLVYQHVFSSMDPTVSAQLPAISIVEQAGAGLDSKFASMCSQSLVMRGEGPARLSASESLVGSGKTTKPSGITIADIVNLVYAYQSQVLLTLEDESAVITNAATAPQRLNSWEFGIQNQVNTDDGFRPGAAAFQTTGDPDSGEVRSEMLLIDQLFNMRFNLRLLNDSTFFAALTSQEDFIALFDIVGPIIEDAFNYKLQIKGYKAPFRVVNKQSRNGLVVVDIENNVQYDTTAGKDVEVTLINNVPSYTT